MEEKSAYAGVGVLHQHLPVILLSPKFDVVAMANSISPALVYVVGEEHQRRRVGEIAVRKTLEGKLIIVPGMLAKISAAIIRTLPKRWMTSIYNRSDQGTN